MSSCSRGNDCAAPVMVDDCTSTVKSALYATFYGTVVPNFVLCCSGSLLTQV